MTIGAGVLLAFRKHFDFNVEELEPSGQSVVQEVGLKRKEVEDR